jgi:hypothetical protein
MIQTKPKKRATGSRKNAGVTIKLRLDSSAIAARTRPSHTSHRGSILVNQAITDTPASSKPNGTTYPTPPVAKASRCKALLSRIAEQQGLSPGVHPGYRRVGKKRRR